jgi:DNA helicase-4
MYREYAKDLRRNGKVDFDDLLMLAAEQVKITNGSCRVHIGRGKSIAVSELKWLLIDEYQDFSELYYGMLSAILDVNPGVRLVAVGDDWQAINAVAGAELRFFKDFEHYFPGAASVGVTTNRRSDGLIVSAGNQLMSGPKSKLPAKTSRTGSGFIEIRNLHKTYVEFKAGEENAVAREEDAAYFPALDGKRKWYFDSEITRARALKACAEIFCKAPDRKTLLLSRTNNAYGMKLTKFREKLISILATKFKLDPTSVEDHVLAMTCHKAKGQEAHSVIVLEAIAARFPMIHSDNALFETFGVTADSVFEEERRLFYVAISRAEHCLYLLTESDRESPFLNALRSVTNGVKVAADPAPDETKLGVIARAILDQLRISSTSSGSPAT